MMEQPRQRLLLQRSTGRVYVWTQPLSIQDDMRDFAGPMPAGGRLSDEELRKITGKGAVDCPPGTRGPEAEVGRFQLPAVAESAITDPTTVEEARAMLAKAQAFFDAAGWTPPTPGEVPPARFGRVAG